MKEINSLDIQLTQKNDEPISKYGKKNLSKKPKQKIYKYFFVFFFSSLAIIILLYSIKNPFFPKYEITSKKYDQIIGTPERDILNAKALKMKLNPYPMIHYFLNRTDYLLLNVFFFIKFSKKDIDFNRLYQAFNKTIYHHPALLSRFYKNENGSIYMQYRPDQPPKIEIINIKEEEIPKLNQSLLTLFKPFDSPMGVFRLYISEKNIYLFIDVFHSNIDGNSENVFQETLEAAYLNKTLPKDYYFLDLYEYNQNINGIKYNKSKEYYLKYFNTTKNNFPKFDEDIPIEIKNSQSIQIITRKFGSFRLREKLTEHFGKLDREYNIFMSMNILLSNYIYSNFTDNAPEFRPGFNGRDFKTQKYSLGCLLSPYPIKYEFHDKKVNMLDFFEHIRYQLSIRKKLDRYPFFHTEKNGGINCIMQRNGSFMRNKLFGKNCEFVYHYDNLSNLKTKMLMSPITMEFTISKNYAEYFFFFEGKLYKESSADRYVNIMEKTADFIMENFNTENEISLENLL